MLNKINFSFKKANIYNKNINIERILLERHFILTDWKNEK